MTDSDQRPPSICAGIAQSCLGRTNVVAFNPETCMSACDLTRSFVGTTLAVFCSLVLCASGWAQSSPGPQPVPLPPPIPAPLDMPYPNIGDGISRGVPTGKPLGVKKDELARTQRTSRDVLAVRLHHKPGEVASLAEQFQNPVRLVPFSRTIAPWCCAPCRHESHGGREVGRGLAFAADSAGVALSN